MEICIDDVKITYESWKGEIKNDVGIYSVLHKLKFGDKIHGISFTDAEKIIQYINDRNEFEKCNCIYYKDTMLLVKK